MASSLVPCTLSEHKQNAKYMHVPISTFPQTTSIPACMAPAGQGTAGPSGGSYGHRAPACEHTTHPTHEMPPTHAAPPMPAPDTRMRPIRHEVQRVAVLLFQRRTGRLDAHEQLVVGLAGLEMLAGRSGLAGAAGEHLHAELHQLRLAGQVGCPPAASGCAALPAELSAWRAALPSATGEVSLTAASS